MKIHYVLVTDSLNKSNLTDVSEEDADPPEHCVIIF